MFSETVSFAVIILLLYIQDNMGKKTKTELNKFMIFYHFFHVNNWHSKIKSSDFDFYLLWVGKVNITNALLAINKRKT